jgi:hypothetical protein
MEIKILRDEIILGIVVLNWKEHEGKIVYRNGFLAIGWHDI